MNHIFRFLLRIAIVAIVGALSATVIWYFFSAKTAEAYTSILFWLGAAVIALGAVLFGGHSDLGLAPGKFGSAEAIDPKDMDYGRNLRRKSEYVLAVMAIAGGLIVVASLLLTEW